jgi:hypothetical protein
MTAKIHPDFPDYEIHDDGRVFRIRVGRQNKGKIGEISGRVLKESGYRQFKLCHADGSKVVIRANRLITEVFHGPAPSEEHHACHDDGVRLNNRADNLRWDTPKGNAADQIIHGTRLKGALTKQATLTNEQVLQMRLLFCGKRGQIRELSAEFGVSANTVQGVVYGRTYPGIGEIKFTAKTKITSEDRWLILQTYLSKGFTEAKKVTDGFGLSNRCIAAIARRHGFFDNRYRGRSASVREIS